MKYLFWMVLALLGASQQLLADTLTFVNGDQLQGEIKSMQGGKLVFISSMVGKITVPAASIASFSTDAPAELHFQDGTVLKRQVSATEGGIALDGGSIVSPQTIPFAQITRINPPVFEIKWTGRIGAGLSLKQGNTESQDGYADIDAKRETKKDRILFDAEYIENKETNIATGVETTSKRRYALGAHYDYFIGGDNTYVYGEFSAEKEVTANLDLRMTSGTGFGYRWLNTDKQQLDTEGGLSWVTENFSDLTEDEDYLAARVGWRYQYLINDLATFFHSGEWFGSLDDGDDYLVKSETGLRSKIMSALSAEVKVIFDWDNTPALGKEQEDVTYVIGLGYDF